MFCVVESGQDGGVVHVVWFAAAYAANGDLKLVEQGGLVLFIVQCRHAVILVCGNGTLTQSAGHVNVEGPDFED